MAPDTLRPRSFFLNESHELTRGKKESGGRAPKLAPIDWGSKGMRIGTTLQMSVRTVAQLGDPANTNHCYLLARPSRVVRKLTENRTLAPSGVVDELTSFAGKDSRVFTRLGMNMLNVTNDGAAVVHVTPQQAQQLYTTASTLETFGPRDRARWITLDSFEVIPSDLRLDHDWFVKIRAGSLADSVIELQPLLTRGEVDEVMRALLAAVQINAPHGQSIRSSGSDFSGRQWLRANLSRDALKVIADSFMSVQSLHSPLLSSVAGSVPQVIGQSVAVATPPPPQAPRIAIVDTGVPSEHLVLGPYRQGQYVTPYNAGGVGPHGSVVASRALFGDVNPNVSNALPQPSLRFFDVNVAIGPHQIDDKLVIAALQAVVSTSPDIRVFNLSFDCPPLGIQSVVQKAEYLRLAQDLDNFVFQNDVLIVAAAGNTPSGVKPTTSYPNHYGDPQWSLGAFASSFNAITCGCYVSQIPGVGALVKDVGWPSPFCRTGFGIAESYKPDFSAAGGNSNQNYSMDPGMGVWGIDANGNWSERCGTSFAAPLLSREAAFAFQALEKVCSPGNRPYAALVKAFLALTASRPVETSAIKRLVERTQGYGTASASRLSSPAAGSAIFLWQGLLEDKDDMALIQIPVPMQWLLAANSPKMKLVISADVPVNAAASEIWASRKISVKIRPTPDSKALRAQKRRGGDSYALVSQEYNFRKVDVSALQSDMWVVEIAYEDVADYLPSMAFASQQRVAFVAELFDDSPAPASPQALLQTMPIVAGMNRLTAQTVIARTPVVLRY
jgi:Subtilase family